LTDLARWKALLDRLGAKHSVESVFAALEERYAEAHRAYHTYAHVQASLVLFDEAGHLAAHPDEVEAALWLHDVIYDPRAADNEEQSARWADRYLGEAGVPGERLLTIGELILVTRHDGVPSSVGAQLVVDIDLAILGAEQEAFDLYERQIRLEYDWVAEETFCRRRAAVLTQFLKRERIYQTPFFRERYEAQARANLARSLSRLGRAHG
jgi:predicted metal-dependent HD superfamily phosphohydrolase